MSSTQSVLDAMTAGIMGAKANKATGLTPVGSEKGGPLAGALPSDVPGVLMSNEALTDISSKLKADAATMLAIANGIDILLGIEGPTQDHKDQQAAQARKLAEREADRKADDRTKAAEGNKGAATRVEFAEKFEAQQKAAQASVFKNADASVERRQGEWSCSTHTEPPVRLLSRKGRSYLMCSQVGCEEFERSQ